MSAAAVIVGIDDYQMQPLTSAVRDATSVRAELLALGLVTEPEVTLLTSPVVEGAALADRRGIVDAMQTVYDTGPAVDRLFVFFAGHGLLAPVDASRAVYHTAFAPVDVRDLRRDAELLLDVDDLVERLVLAGPRAQYLFVDACRDLAFEQSPGSLRALAWPESSNPSPYANSHAVLYAVSPFGKARSQRDGMGVMTSFLIRALRGEGRALEWSSELDSWVVTADSVKEYVRARILETVSGEPLWQQQYMLPELRRSEPGDLPPIRLVEQPPDRTLTLTFDPSDAAARTTVTLFAGPSQLANPTWPPHLHGEAVPVPPQRYRLSVSSELGPAAADPPRIDCRELEAATIYVGASPPAPVAPAVAAPGEATVSDHEIRAAGRMALLPKTALVAEANEPEAAIEATATHSPYTVYRALGRLQTLVPPGSYRVRFRIGDDTFSETEVDVGLGETKLVKAAAETSPLLRAITGGDGSGLRVQLGLPDLPAQGALLTTVLTLLGAKPFDESDQLAGRLDGLVEARHAGDFGDHPVTVVVAVDGEGWPIPAAAVAGSLRCDLAGGAAEATPVPLAPVARDHAGWLRVVQGFVVAPRRAFALRLVSPYFGTVEAAIASLPRRITVVVVIVQPDGRLRFAQHLLRVPGWAYEDELAPHVPYDRSVRELALGEELYQAGELIETAIETRSDRLKMLAYAKWTDPILGCMAYYGWHDRLITGPEDRRDEAGYMAATIARNLDRFFPDLPDAAVIAAGELGLSHADRVDRCLDEGAVPVLGRSCRELGRIAAARGVPESAVTRWAAIADPASAWTLRFAVDVAGWR